MTCTKRLLVNELQSIMILIRLRVFVKIVDFQGCVNKLGFHCCIVVYMPSWILSCMQARVKWVLLT
jgi:hypothetical protein